MSTLRVLVLILAHCSLMLSQVPLEAPIRDIQIAPNASTTIYVLPSLGLLRSTDGGATWTQLAVLPKNTQPPALRAFTFAPQSASTMYAGGEPAAGGILWKSMDSGATWQNISQDLPMDEGYRVTHIDAIGTSVYAHIQVSSSQWELWMTTARPRSRGCGRRNSSPSTRTG
ncbi:MAG: WD40/YVTN/BNR-like repeat-containing protein [Bryobacteraceae bacterium]